jgi:hypothetical protein
MSRPSLLLALVIYFIFAGVILFVLPTVWLLFLPGVSNRGYP